RPGQVAPRRERRQRHAVPVRGVGRLRPGARPRKDRGPAHRRQLRRRPGEPARAGYPGAGDPPGETGPVRRHPDQRRDAGPRDAPAAGGREAAPGSPPGRAAAIRPVSAGFVSLLAAWLGGAAATYLFDDDAPLPARLALGGPLGLAVFGLAGFAAALGVGLG